MDNLVTSLLKTRERHCYVPSSGTKNTVVMANFVCWDALNFMSFLPSRRRLFNRAENLFVGELLLVNIYLYRVVKLNMLHFYRELLRYSMPAILVSGLLALQVSNYVPPSWFGLIMGCLITGFIYVTSSYFLSLMSNERKEVNRLIFRRW